MLSWNYVYEWFFPSMTSSAGELHSSENPTSLAKVENYELIPQDVFTRECVGITLSKTYAEVCKTKQIKFNNKPLMRA